MYRLFYLIDNHFYKLEFDRNEIYRIENFRMSVKDFELIAFATVLELDMNKLKEIILEDEYNDMI